MPYSGQQAHGGIPAQAEQPNERLPDPVAAGAVIRHGFAVKRIFPQYAADLQLFGKGAGIFPAEYRPYHCVTQIFQGIGEEIQL